MLKASARLSKKKILLDKVDLRDESTYDTRVVVEKVYKKQCDMKELYNRIYKKITNNRNLQFSFF